MLVEKYRAYEIPVSTFSKVDFANDEEVRESLIDSLWTITHPRVIAALARGGPLEDDPDGLDQDMRNLFSESNDPEISLAYHIQVIQIAHRQRVSVLLEAEGDICSGFKVYGPNAEALVDEMIVTVGFPERQAHSHPDGPSMRRGDIQDATFVFYLRKLAEAGAI